jgi:hypothetical protein
MIYMGYIQVKMETRETMNYCGSLSKSLNGLDDGNSTDRKVRIGSTDIL